MSDPYLGEVRLFAGNFAPQGWALCNGQLLNINDNQALFALLGTTYGGDGQTNFALPDLQGRVPMHKSNVYPLGNKGGTETVQLTLNQLPAHTHVPNATTNNGTTNSPNGSVWATTPAVYYSNNTTITPVNMDPTAISPVGSNQPHENMMPSLTVSFIIALQGIYPVQG